MFAVIIAMDFTTALLAIAALKPMRRRWFLQAHVAADRNETHAVVPCAVAEAHPDRTPAFHKTTKPQKREPSKQELKADEERNRLQNWPWRRSSPAMICWSPGFFTTATRSKANGG